MSEPASGRRFWVSWYQPTEDYRPLRDLPDARILGWWCSGYDADDTPIICALVIADDIDQMRRVVAIDWPEPKRWRFEREVPSDFTPSDRFPMKAEVGMSPVGPAQPIEPVSRCLRCDGTGETCDVCGESEHGCRCEESTFSECAYCEGTGE